MEPLHLVVIGDPQARYLRLLDQLPEGTVVTKGAKPDDLLPAAAEAEAVLICTGRSDVLEVLWPKLSRLRWVHSMAAGIEAVLFRNLVESDIPVTNSRGVYKESLGEFVLAATLFFAKDLRRMIRSQEARRWDQFEVEEIRRQSMGILGYGEIGQAAARRAHALGMQVHAVRRRPELSANDSVVARSYRMEDRAEMMAAVDYVVVAAPLTPQTRGLVGDAEIRGMKNSAVLMNIGRGPVIDEVALLSALQDRRIRGAALDVFDEEPLPESHPFWRLDNVLLSPHTADRTATWQDEAIEFFLENFKLFHAGKELKNVVDKAAGY